jgi:hypothetical protein
MKAAKAKTAALVEKEKALAELKKSLMHDLLTGRVRVTLNSSLGQGGMGDQFPAFEK